MTKINPNAKWSFETDTGLNLSYYKKVDFIDNRSIGNAGFQQSTSMVGSLNFKNTNPGDHKYGSVSNAGNINYLL